MFQRRISMEDIRRVLETGEVIEEYQMTLHIQADLYWDGTAQNLCM